MTKKDNNAASGYLKDSGRRFVLWNYLIKMKNTSVLSCVIIDSGKKRKVRCMKERNEL